MTVDTLAASLAWGCGQSGGEQLRPQWPRRRAAEAAVACGSCKIHRSTNPHFGVFLSFFLQLFLRILKNLLYPERTPHSAFPSPSNKSCYSRPGPLVNQLSTALGLSMSEECSRTAAAPWSCGRCRCLPSDIRTGFLLSVHAAQTC